MKSKTKFFSAILLSSTFAFAAYAADDLDKAAEPFMKDAITFTPLKGDVQMVTGPGGNIVAIPSANGTLLIDDGIGQRAAALDGALQHNEFKNVNKIIDTHYHFDHTGGNAYFGKKGATIIAQENVKTRMSQSINNEVFKVTFPASPKEALPTISFKNSLQVEYGDHHLVLTHVDEPAHTDGDSFVFIQDQNIIHTGDLYFNGLYPFIDYGVGGWIGGMVNHVDKIIAMADDKTIIVPGHGKASNKSELQTYRNMLADIQQKVEKLVADGKSEDEAVAAKPTAIYDDLWGKGLFTGEVFTRIVYRGIVQHQKTGTAKS